MILGKRCILISNFNRFIFFLFLLLAQPVFSSNNMGNDLFVISPGGELIKYSLENGKLKRLNSLLADKKWSDAYWPTYDREKKLIYFEAENKDFGQSRQIFYINIVKKNQRPIKVIEGRRPSISLNGCLLAYYQHPNELWILEIKSQKKKSSFAIFLIINPLYGYLISICYIQMITII